MDNYVDILEAHVRRSLDGQARPETIDQLVALIRDTVGYAYTRGLDHGRAFLCPRPAWWEFWRAR